MRKKFLKWLKCGTIGAMRLLIGLTISTTEVSAEQAAAEQYRQMFRSGNFYVECQASKPFGNYIANSGISTYAGQNGKRMQRTVRQGNFGSYGIFSVSAFAIMQPDDFYSESSQNFNVIDMYKTGMYTSEKSKKRPDFLYQNGKYYRFEATRANKNVIGWVLSENQSDYSTAKNIRKELALPKELAVFYWDDPFKDKKFNLPAPHYNGSSTRTVDEKTYECDQYISDIKSMTGTLIAQEAYNMLYNDGKLVMVQKYLIRDGKEYHALDLKIINLTAEVPDSAFAIEKKIKVYAVPNGDLNELIGKNVLVEEIGGKQK